jgi:LCP family protein required for cell wall assembly
MQRQKPKVGQNIDGFNRNNIPRSHLYLDRKSSLEPSINNLKNKNSALPSLRPRPIPYANNANSLNPQQDIRFESNRTTPTRRPSAVDSVNRSFERSINRSTVLLPHEPLNNSQSNTNSDKIASLNSFNNWSTGNSPRQSTTLKTKKKFKLKKTLVMSLVTLTVMVLGLGGWFALSLLGNINKVFHGNVLTDAHALISRTPLKESNGRVNILLAGNQGAGSNEGPITDSIMVISINVKTKTGFIISIPRDLWVYIPSMGHQKINAANDVTNFSQPGLPSGGMGQLQQIVQSDLGIPIDYEALIDYAAFKEAVNAVGGININIHSSNPRGLYDPYAHVKLPDGPAFLNGTQALNLARARGDGYGSYGFPNSDFSRTMYQRIMLKSLFSKAMSAGVLTNPVTITNLFSAFSSNVQTNMSLGDIISLAHLGQGVNLANLKSTTYSFGLPNGILTNYTSPKNGQESLIPTLGLGNFSQLKAYYAHLVSTTSNSPVKKP